MAVGTRLGNIEIVGQLGAGGMGEVYRGRDTKLDREVAVKVLPSAFAQHPERLARFEREAKVLASLNHPNIATIYAVEESPDGKALVMELVKGQTLEGPVPVDTALKYGAQIASALDAAHEKGITHRDLKPANIMVTPDGTIKVLDFGLAAVTQSSREDGQIGTNMATLTMSPTQAGMIMGTAGYMSPEQASGQTVDRRADIWAFGVVLWELLTGKPLFEGTTVSHILAAVLTREPDFSQVPFRVRRLLRRCLEKDPKKRLRDVGDAMELVEGDADAAPSAALAPSQSRLGTLAIVAAALFALATAGLSFIHFRETPPVLPPGRFNVTLPGIRLRDMELSPDGRTLSYVNGAGVESGIWVRPLDSIEARHVPGTEGATFPFWSPDGENLGFFAQGKLKRIAVAGGPAQTVCDAPTGRGGSWNRDGVIVFTSDINGGLYRVSADGGTPTQLTKYGRYPEFIGGGKRFLFSNDRGTTPTGIYLGSLDGTAPKRISARCLSRPLRPNFGRTGRPFVVPARGYAHGSAVRSRKACGRW